MGALTSLVRAPFGTPGGGPAHEPRLLPARPDQPPAPAIGVPARAGNPRRAFTAGGRLVGRARRRGAAGASPAAGCRGVGPVRAPLGRPRLQIGRASWSETA